jgi:hypothetical protein
MSAVIPIDSSSISTGSAPELFIKQKRAFTLAGVAQAATN